MSYFGQCTANKDAVHDALKMSDSLSGIANKAGDALKSAAATYTKTGVATFASETFSKT